MSISKLRKSSLFFVVICLSVFVFIACGNSTTEADEEILEIVSSSSMFYSSSSSLTEDLSSSSNEEDLSSSSNIEDLSSSSNVEDLSSSSNVEDLSSSSNEEDLSSSSIIEDLSSSSLVEESSSSSIITNPFELASFDTARNEEIYAMADSDNEYILIQNSGAKIPFLVDNKSRYLDDEVYIAIVANGAPDAGIASGEGAWVDIANNTAMEMDARYNTLSGPAGDVLGWLYADVFTKLSEIPSNTLALPQMESGKIFISFGAPLYLHFHETGGYTQPNLQASTDPNAGIRFETIEFSIGSNGIWINTSRVDAYQYPMGLEVYGEGVGASRSYCRMIGELMNHESIISKWQSEMSTEFQTCYNSTAYLANGETDGIIHQPSKVAEFSDTYFDEYIEEVWETYATKELVVNFGDIGDWKGGIVNDTMVMSSSGKVGKAARPATNDVIEGAGTFATGSVDDMNVQKFLCAAFNRGAIDVSTPDGVSQDWKSESMYFLDGRTYNEYVGFFHDPAISYNSETYAFAYDDVFEHSSTVQANDPRAIRVTIGGYAGVSNFENGCMNAEAWGAFTK